MTTQLSSSHLLLSATLTLAAVAISGCGAKSDDAAGATATDTRSVSASSSAVGTATDAGLNALYGGGAVAWQPELDFRTRSDGPTDEVMRSVTDAPPAPHSGSGDITVSTYTNPLMTSGTIHWQADSSGLPAGWYHVSLTFDSAAPFTVTTENGDVATIASGVVDFYVHNVDGSNDGVGNWTRTVDTWTSISGTPLQVSTTVSGGISRSATITGLRHAHRAITRTKDAGTGTITRADAVTIDGDLSDLSVLSLSPALSSGPSMADRAGASHPFTKWQHVVTSEGVTHTNVWNRYCTYTASYTYAPGTVSWTGTFSGVNENIYLTHDGVTVGPLTDAQVVARFQMLHNLNKAAGQF